MGPIRGFRIVNLRVKAKTAYPDLSLDINEDHVVVGLENGGGKSTLNGFVLHVIVPAANQFGPRRAQRRARKAGKEKLIEHYIPGRGAPTHIVLELELPPTGRGQVEKVLIGACLYWKGNPKSGGKVEEFFWSARQVCPELTLTGLPLRADANRLRDHNEWQQWLKEMKSARPESQILIETSQYEWGKHLSGQLKVDVDYVKTWLLKMNDEEGAADHVFTFGSDREFLDSLIAAVANADQLEAIKAELTKRAADADTQDLDARRAVLLSSIMGQIEPVAQMAANLRDADQLRLLRIDEALATALQLGAVKRLSDQRLATHHAATAAAAQTLQRATAAADEAQLLAVLADKQHAEHRLRDSDAALAEVSSRIDEANREAATFRAAAALAKQRQANLRIRQAEQALSAKSADAEPVRRDAASAALAWQRAVGAEQQRIAGQAQARAADRDAARDSERSARRRQTAANRSQAHHAEAARSAREALELLNRLVKEAVGRADLSDGQDADAALRDARNDVAEQRRAAARTDDDATRVQQELDEVGTQLETAAADAAAGRSSAQSARDRLDHLRQATDGLTSELSASGLLDNPDIALDDAAELIDELLAGIEETEHARQLNAAVQAAAVRRSSLALESTGVLPARADVMMLCEKASAESLGVRPGWSYLMELPADTAAAYAAAHPGLADGIVVTIPADLAATAQIVQAARQELNGPVVIGTAASFAQHDEPGQVQVVLPDEAYWSRQAGQLVLERYRSAHHAHEKELTYSQSRHEQAVRLRARLADWTIAVGPGACADAERTCAALGSEAERLQQAHQELVGTATELRARRAEALAEAQRIRTYAESLQPRLDRLSRLTDRLADKPAFLRRLRDADEGSEQARRDGRAADNEARSARRAFDAANQDVVALEKEATSLQHLHADASALCATVVREGDSIDDADAGLDRATLEDLAITRSQVWNGSIADPELRAAIASAKSSLNEAKATLKNVGQDVKSEAEAKLAADRTRSEDDFRHAAEAAANQSAGLAAELADRRFDQRSDGAAVEAAAERYEKCGRLGVLDGTCIATDTAHAAKIAERLRSAHDRANATQSSAEQTHTAAVAAAETVQRRGEVIDDFRERLIDKIARPLSVRSQFMGYVDQDDREYDIADVLSRILDSAPASVSALLSALGGNDMDGPQLRDAASAHFTDLVATADALGMRRAKIEQVLHEQLDQLLTTLRDADHNTISGDKLLLTLRGLRGEELLEHADIHVEQTRQRLAKVKHSVASFDLRVEKSAELVSAALTHVMTDVKQTVAASLLPGTPAMGRWAGLHLLKIGGLDKLSAAQRHAAVHATLQNTFDSTTKATKKNAFDADKTLQALITAITPALTARVLVPSDPLNPEHQPVDELAKETSGGEGVTFALILASLLAARRAANNGHRNTTLILDNPFSKLNKPHFLRLIRDVASSLGVQIVALTGIKDAGALTVFPSLIQLRLSRRQNAKVVTPIGISDAELQDLLHDGTIYVSAAERAAAQAEDVGDPDAFPTISQVRVDRLGNPAEHQ